jgi:mRNA interferase MazF
MRRGNVVAPGYVPDRGHVVWTDFNPRIGHEQAGRRPAVVLSPTSYNRTSGLVVVCPITSHAKGYPFEVPLPAGLAITGVVLADAIKSIDWQVRGITYACDLPTSTQAELMARLAPLLGFRWP